jgi:hypothetical protein
MRTLGHILLPHVYISAPVVGINPENNVKHAIDIADELYTSGVCLPVVPQLQYFWNKFHPHDDTFWDEMNYQILKRCDALLAFGEDEFPQDMELVEEAERIGIPVFYSTDELTDWKESE